MKGIRAAERKRIQRGFDELVDRPVLTSTQVMDPLDQLLLLRAREREIEAGNPYQKSFTRFRTELCWTKDEAGGGKVRLLPDWPYLRNVDRALIVEHPLFFEKSRRTLISWTVCAFDLWLLAGGSDPRWCFTTPEGELVQPLLPTKENPECGNRRVLIGSQKLEGPGGSAEYLERVRFIVDQFEERGGRQKWPDFPEFKWSFQRGNASNGSTVSAVPQGEDAMRGPGATFVHMEEFHTWTKAKESVGSALQTLRGGGHLCTVATARAASYAAVIATDNYQRGFR